MEWNIKNVDIFLNKGKKIWNSELILDDYNKKLEQNNINLQPKLVKSAKVYWYNLANSLNQKGRRDLIKKIKEQDFKFMLEWFDRNNLDNNLELIRSFREKMETNSSESSFF